jgi:hypothetical protein
MRPARASLFLAAAVLPVLAGPVPAAPSALAPGPAASLAACIAGLDSLDIGYERIAARCPGLAAALQRSEYAAWLPRDWKRPGNELSAAGLTQLQRLLLQELATHPGSHAPEVAHLAAVLAQLPGAGQPSPWRTRLTGWLRGGTPTPAARATGLLGWMGLAQSPPAQVLHAFLILAVLLATFLAAYELRLLGLRVRPPARSSQSPPVVPAAPEAALPGDIGVLLAAVAAHLAARGHVPASWGLTARELARAAQLPPAQRADLLTLGRAAEALRYAPVPPAAAELAAALEHGKRLMRGLAHEP